MGMVYGDAKDFCRMHCLDHGSTKKRAIIALHTVYGINTYTLAMLGRQFGRNVYGNLVMTLPSPRNKEILNKLQSGNS